MRQLRNCKVGHFVKYKGVLCQVNCFHVDFFRERFATLVEVKHGLRHWYNVNATTKVEYIGETATDEHGTTWVFHRRDPVEEWNNR